LAVLVALSFLLIAPSALAAHLDIVPYFEADGAGGYEFSVGRFDFTKTADPLNGRPPAPIERNVLVFTGFFGTHPVNGQIVNGDPGWDLPPNFADYGDSGADFPTGTQPPRNGRLKFNVVSDPRLGRNLSYWDGAGAPSFGPVPDGEILDIFKPVFAGTPESVTLNGSDESLSGFELTSNPLFPGNFHTHTGHVLWGDASRSTDPSHLPTAGFYLFSLNMEIDNGAVIPNYPNLSTTVSGIDAVSPTFHVILTYGFQNGYDEFIYGDQELQERGEYVYDDGLDDYIWVPELDGEGNPILDPVFDEFGNPVLEVIGVGGFILGPEMQQAADWVHANLAQVPEPGAAVGLVVMLVSGSWLRVRNKFSLV
jgi:hypothetical protein